MRFLAVTWALTLLLLTGDQSHSSVPEPSANPKLWEYRNLGKAFYENPDTHQQAAEALKKALDLAPGSIQERVNYGLALLRAGQIDQGTAQLVQVQKQDPSLPHTWFNLGIVYKHAGDYDHAIEQFRGMTRLEPNEPAGHYNLAASLRSKGDVDAALSELLEAERLNPDLSGPHFQLFTLYQRAHDSAKASAERKLFEEAKKRNEGAAVPEDMEWCYWAELYDPPEPRPATEPTVRFQESVVAHGLALGASQLLPINSRIGGGADLLVVNRGKIQLLKQAKDLVRSGLESLDSVIDVSAGDYDNDGLMDLCVVSTKGVSLYRGADNSFSKTTDLGAAGSTKAIWLDFDHDNDLDLLLFGPHPTLFRNVGGGRFKEEAQAFPFIPGPVLDATVTALRGDTAARDLIVTYADRPALLYRDKLNGIFEHTDLVGLPAGSSQLSITDLDHDGLLDVVAYLPRPLALHNRETALEAWPDAKIPTKAVRADFNGDGREDFVAITAAGDLKLAVAENDAKHWLAVRIEGVKNPKAALNATVEVKAGPYYEKRIYNGVPLAFSLGDRAEADTVRITWPNGLIQNETGKKPAPLLRVEEAQRLSGSCPMIFTWDGKQYRFVTDVLGVAPLGASAGDGKYFPVDHDEYVQIPGAAIKPVDGQLRLRITEELHEVSYLDKVELIALDHPAQTVIATNDKFKSPPYPEFRLFGSDRPVHPVRAVEDGRRDVTTRVLAKDGVYADGFVRTVNGIAKVHTLDLDFGQAAKGNRAVLVLNGWVDWADGSTFLAASQSGHPLQFPSVQVRDRQGRWQTVVADMGIPSGKPKTIAVDLTGKFLSDDRTIRITTDLCVYWDEITLFENSQNPQVRLTRLTAQTGELGFRGFSRVQVDPKRQQPERFEYDQVRAISNWNPTDGRYTRYGNVQPLVTQTDDKLVVMGSGDELSLSYSADGLPSLPVGWTRDYLLLVDGWAKDADANTAFSQSVEPLPFHGMSAYPYPSGEHFPSDLDHRQYVEKYLTRPALHLIQPLASAPHDHLR